MQRAKPADRIPASEFLWHIHFEGLDRRGSRPLKGSAEAGSVRCGCAAGLLREFSWEVVDMGISRTTTERQLKLAKDDLAGIGARLSKAGVAEAAFTKNTDWREADAKVRQIQRRLRKIGEVETRDAEAERVKAEKLATPKVKKEKVKAPKAAPKKEKAEKGPGGDKAPKPKKEKSGK